jgi:hypothetical protein
VPVQDLTKGFRLLAHLKHESDSLDGHSRCRPLVHPDDSCPVACSPLPVLASVPRSDPQPGRVELSCSRRPTVGWGGLVTRSEFGWLEECLDVGRDVCWFRERRWCWVDEQALRLTLSLACSGSVAARHPDPLALLFALCSFPPGHKLSTRYHH